MGGKCCKESHEASKQPIFEPNIVADIITDKPQSLIQPKSQRTNPRPSLNRTNQNHKKNTNKPKRNGRNQVLNETQHQKQKQVKAERKSILKEEKKRLESIVEDMERDMVGFKSDTIGNITDQTIPYYDLVRATSTEQNLLKDDCVFELEAAYRDFDNKEIITNDNTSAEEGFLARMVSGRNKLPPTTVANGIDAVEELSRPMDLFNDMETGGNTMEVLEIEAERFLASVIPSKESLFQDVEPIVEHLG